MALQEFVWVRGLGYPHQEFPVIEGDNPLCVLCQQVVAAEARDRLSRFRDFMEGEVARLAEPWPPESAVNPELQIISN